MTRFLALLTAATLLAGPGLAFDLPNLTFPTAQAGVTQSTSGQTPAPAPTTPAHD